MLDDDEEDDDDKNAKNISKEKKNKAEAKKNKTKRVKFRWGQRKNESNEEYDKRFAKVLKRTKQDPKGDTKGGVFLNAKGQRVRLWTYKGRPFIVRSDIDAEFTAHTAMYMEMLHREYGAAYKKFLGVPAKITSPIEVIVFADRATYMRNGGSPGSGGFFMAFAHITGDRSPEWPARHCRLQQFTSGIREFEKWEKGTLKHEAAHMELQLRLGFKSAAEFGGFGIPLFAPRWFNEGHAAVFEYWDFSKNVEENLADVPNRGRYAPVIRRVHDTDRWKNFDYVWTVDAQTWAKDMTSDQGFLNYAQAWSLAAYMMCGGQKGRKDFVAIFDLCKRVGITEDPLRGETRDSQAWLEKFPEETKETLEKSWNEWVGTHVSREKRVPDEEFYLRRQGYNPDIVDRLAGFESEEDQKKNAEWVRKETRKRKNSRKIQK